MQKISEKQWLEDRKIISNKLNKFLYNISKKWQYWQTLSFNFNHNLLIISETKTEYLALNYMRVLKNNLIENIDQNKFGYASLCVHSSPSYKITNLVKNCQALILQKQDDVYIIQTNIIYFIPKNEIKQPNINIFYFNDLELDYLYAQIQHNFNEDETNLKKIYNAIESRQYRFIDIINGTIDNVNWFMWKDTTNASLELKLLYYQYHVKYINPSNLFGQNYVDLNVTKSFVDKHIKQAKEDEIGFFTLKYLFYDYKLFNFNKE